MTIEEKQIELIRLRDINQATLDYYILLHKKYPTPGYDPTEHFKSLKPLVDQHFEKGRLTILRQLLRDFTEIFQEGGGFEYMKYIKEKTGYEVDVLRSLQQRIEKILAKGKITTDNQYRDIMSLLNNLPEADQLDEAKTEMLNQLLVQYEVRKEKNPE